MTSERFRNRILSMAQWAEGLPLSLGRWLLLLAAIIVLRHFLEQMSGQTKTIYFLSYFIHYPLAYVAPLLALSVLLSVLARERVERVTRLMLFAWLLTLLPPLIDIAAHSGGDAPELIGYLIPRDSSLGAAFLNLFNPAFSGFQGTTTGIRVEAALGCLLGAYYVYLKTRNVGRAILSFFAIYVTMFFFFALPPITLAVARLFGSQAENVYLLMFAKADVHRAFANATPFAVSDLSNSLIDLIVIAPLLAVWYRLYDRDRFAELVRGIDPARALFHVAAALGGAAIGARLLMGSEGLYSVSVAFDAISLIGIGAASFFAALTAGTMRELHSEASGPEADSGRMESLRVHSTFCFSLACLFALSVSYVALTYVLAALAAWYLYHARPFRLARFPLLGGFVAGAALLFMLSLGYSAYAGASASLWMPGSLTALSLFVPTLSFLTVQAMSTSDERFTIRSILGERHARTVAAAGVLLSCLLPGVLLAKPLLLVPGLVVGLLAFALIARGPDGHISAGLSVLAAVLILAAGLTGAWEAPILKAQLNAGGFVGVGRRAGTFSLSQVDRDASTAMQEGLDLFEEGNYEASVQAFRRALESDPDNVDAYLSIGSAYLRLERLSESARAFRRALDLDPESVKAHVGLGQTYQLYGDYDSAFEELTKALELDPDNVDAVYSLAVFFESVGDTEQEMAALERTLELSPGRAAAYRRLAEIHAANGMHERAIETLNLAISRGVEFDHVYSQLAHSYYRSGNSEAAEQAIRKEIERHPRMASPRAVLARLLAERGDTEGARAELGKAISLTADPRLKARFEEELRQLGG